MIRRKHIARAKRLQCTLIPHLNCFVLVANEYDWPGTGLVATFGGTHTPGRQPSIVTRDESKSVVHFFGAVDRPPIRREESDSPSYPSGIWWRLQKTKLEPREYLAHRRQRQQRWRLGMPLDLTSGSRPS